MLRPLTLSVVEDQVSRMLCFWTTSCKKPPSELHGDILSKKSKSIILQATADIGMKEAILGTYHVQF